jgi:membrane associated rhomboid family serine protease
VANCVKCGRQLPSFSFKKICQWCVQHEAQQRGEIAEDARQPVVAAPWVRRGEPTITLTRVLFGANIAVFLATVLTSGTVDNFPFPVSVALGANYGPFTLSGEWWRLITYMFIHGGIFHILINMWCLWSFGDLCESLYGRWTYLGVYLVTGIAGGLASAAWNPGVWSVGASGALFGLTGALIASIYLGEFSISAVSTAGILSSLIFWGAFSLIFGFISPEIDNGCHVGGLLSGLALGAVIAKFAPHEEHAPRRILLFIVALLVLAGCAAVLTYRYGIPLRLGRSPFHH